MTASPLPRGGFFGACFAIGAIAGSLLDAVHTHTGTTRYPEPIVFRMAWWTPLLFGTAGVLVLAAAPLAERVVRRPVATVRSGIGEALAFLAFVASYVVSGVLPTGNLTKLTVMTGLFVSAVVLVGRTLVALVLAAIGAIAGPVVEIVLVGRGAFAHLQPDFAGIPMWLPALYAAAPVACAPVGLRLAKAFAKRASDQSS